MTYRRQRGAVLGLVVALALVLVLIIVGVWVLTMYMGGSREVRNTVDSGALNVGKQIMVRVKEKSSGGTVESQFDEMKDKNGEFGLGNINRVWSKALLVAANYEAMSNEGSGGGNANSHNSAIFDAAKSISDRLANKLNTPTNLHPFFNEVADKNSVRMIGPKSGIKAAVDAQWKTSLVDRGVESNILIDDGQIPSGVTVPKTKAEDGDHLPGYQPFTVGGHTFTFVPFKVKERTHLIAGSVFKENTKEAKAIDWTTPVPNAYSCYGRSVLQQGKEHDASAYVQPNPQKYYNLGMRGFIRINFPGNDIQYVINAIPSRKSTYSNRTGSDTQIFIPEVGTGTLTVSASVGNEYVGTLGTVMYNPLVPGNWNASKQRILQRCQELQHDFTMAKLDALLLATPFVPGQDTYLIFPAPAGDTLLCLPESVAQAASGGWLNKDAQADGTEKDGVTKEYNSMVPNTVSSAAAVPDPYCSCEPVPPVTLSFIQGWHDWTPGTGYDGCLGTMKIHRKTTFSVNVICHPL